MNIRDQMNRIYTEMSPDDIPWNSAKPPELLTRMVQSGEIQPCKVVDIGCGAGNYSVWLASQGFDVTGLDISDKAVEQAIRLAELSGQSCRFAAVDLLGDLSEFRGAFEFALEWELMHHIFPEDRKTYLNNVYQILKSGGQYLSVCFNEADATFGGEGKYRTTPVGTTLYFSSEHELKELFGSLFDIIDIKVLEIPGKREPHIVNVARLKKP